jgi:hypothetical protein
MLHTELAQIAAMNAKRFHILDRRGWRYMPRCPQQLTSQTTAFFNMRYGD